MPIGGKEGAKGGTKVKKRINKSICGEEGKKEVDITLARRAPTGELNSG